MQVMCLQMLLKLVFLPKAFTAVNTGILPLPHVNHINMPFQRVFICELFIAFFAFHFIYTIWIDNITIVFQQFSNVLIQILFIMLLKFIGSVR